MYGGIGDLLPPFALVFGVEGIDGPIWCFRLGRLGPITVLGSKEGIPLNADIVEPTALGTAVSGLAGSHAPSPPTSFDRIDVDATGRVFRKVMETENVSPA
jgi:hypothetical protein